MPPHQLPRLVMKVAICCSHKQNPPLQGEIADFTSPLLRQNPLYRKTVFTYISVGATK